MLGYWENQCLREYTPGVEESVFDKQALDQGSSYIKDHADRLPVVLLARLGRIWEVFRPVQNVELNEFFEQRGHQASWATLIGYYVMVPFAIGGLVVMRRRRIPIYPFLAIVVAISITVDARVPGHPVPRRVRRGHAGARRGRARRPVAALAASPRFGTRRSAGRLTSREPNRSRSRGDRDHRDRPHRLRRRRRTGHARREPARSRHGSFALWLGGAAGLGLLIRLMNVFWWRPTTDRPGYLGYRLWGDAFYYHHQANALADGQVLHQPHPLRRSTASRWRAPVTRRCTPSTSRSGRRSGSTASPRTASSRVSSASPPSSSSDSSGDAIAGDRGRA